MIKKKFKKLVIILIIVFFVLGKFSLNIYAFTDPTQNANFWEPSISSDDRLASKAGSVLGIINAIGIICSVSILAILGIKYMVASVEEKAEFKKSMVAYIIGIVLIVCTTTLPNIIYNIVFTFKFFG